MNALVVHDNKGSGQQRISRITHRAGSEDVSPVTWDGPPVDLEAVGGCLPASADALLGTDDENLGGSVRAMALC
ncbi:hypothetical protein [Streptomyces sp. NPDC048438]|uniref:hypothetical protein n=1 Tax=Streptomyces sp. NPDC048438 TaxID=3365551 RepID=UPI003716B363